MKAVIPSVIQQNLYSKNTPNLIIVIRTGDNFMRVHGLPRATSERVMKSLVLRIFTVRKFTFEV